MTGRSHEQEMVERVETALGNQLVSIVAYGPALHDGDRSRLPADYMLIVLRDLELATLMLLSSPVRWWLKKRGAWPRIFSIELLRESADVYPIELLDLLQHRRVLVGADPLEGLEVDRGHLRVQCERELREKLMRLREGYIESHGRRSSHVELDELIAISYPSFVRIFRACLFLIDAPVAHSDHDVVIALCTWLDQTPAPFIAAERMAHDQDREDSETTFAAYYHALTVLEARINRMITNPRGRAQ